MKWVMWMGYKFHALIPSYSTHCFHCLPAEPKEYKLNVLRMNECQQTYNPFRSMHFASFQHIQSTKETNSRLWRAGCIKFKIQIEFEISWSAALRAACTAIKFALFHSFHKSNFTFRAQPACQLLGVHLIILFANAHSIIKFHFSNWLRHVYVIYKRITNEGRSRRNACINS